MGTSEASRGHRDPAHGGGWKSLAARKPSLEEDPVHTLRAQADSSGTPAHSRPLLRAPAPPPPRPAGRGNKQGILLPGRHGVSRFPAPSRGSRRGG